MLRALRGARPEARRIKDAPQVRGQSRTWVNPQPPLVPHSHHKDRVLEGLMPRSSLSNTSDTEELGEGVLSPCPICPALGLYDPGVPRVAYPTL
ncbi:hypothetical protein DPEC_G00315170 [Dallia pectoralis]|uniref:Uncharacterized protein n=1 Tax=Dallia pectoralis TaxID=75939 RepID=A0ACC2FC74_DALPE|nr:hypothetical protein DPEC_G00315170 [Dallia pectoralis]